VTSHSAEGREKQNFFYDRAEFFAIYARLSRIRV
jgi:hypothetical protein